MSVSRWIVTTALVTAAPVAPGCGEGPRPILTISGSAVGAEGDVLRAQLTRFEAEHPAARIELRLTPDAADQRHQLYVQWLNARVPDPDVLQLDIVWTAEFAAAGWIQPLTLTAADQEDFFPAALSANRWRGQWYAVPWFVDAGLLYWRTDLLREAPASIEELHAAALRAVTEGSTRAGLVWQGARYEGLVTVFLEHLTAFGGAILDADGRVTVDAPPAVRALTFMRDAVHRDGIVPEAALSWQEEQVRFAFQNGQSLFMRNWPYAWGALQEAGSAVAGRIAIAPFPPSGEGRPASALGGGQLAVNQHSDQPGLARALVAFLTAPRQMLERARVASQLPSRRSLYDSPELAEALPLPLTDVRRALEAAVARPVTPVYSELSELLQVRLHRALTNQEEPAAALRDAAGDIRRLLARTGLAREAGA